MTKPAEQRCRQCGCTNDRACALAFGIRCYWVLEDLCSNPACLFADPRTPPLCIFGRDINQAHGNAHIGLIINFLLRPLGDDEEIPEIGGPNKSLPLAMPAPGPIIEPLLKRTPLQWLLRAAFLDPEINAVEVHPWVAWNPSHLERAVKGVGGLRLCRRRGRTFVRRLGPVSEGGRK